MVAFRCEMAFEMFVHDRCAPFRGVNDDYVLG